MGIRTLAFGHSAQVTCGQDVRTIASHPRLGSKEEPNLGHQSSQPIVVRSKGRLVFLNPHDVRWASANDNYVVLHTAEDRHVVRMTMNALQRSFDPQRFVRIHRSTIVNIDDIRELRGRAHGDYAVVLHDGTRLTLTRSRRTHLLSQLQPASGQ